MSMKDTKSYLSNILTPLFIVFCCWLAAIIFLAVGYRDGVKDGRRQMRNGVLLCAEKNEPAVCFDRVYLWSSSDFIQIHLRQVKKK